MSNLADLQVGQSATVINILGEENIKRRFLDLGIINGSKIECVFKSPFKDPTAYEIKNTTIAIRAEDAKNIEIRSIK